MVFSSEANHVDWALVKQREERRDLLSSSVRLLVEAETRGHSFGRVSNILNEEKA